MFVKKLFGACIRRPSSSMNFSRVDHSETVKWSSDVMRKELGAYRPPDYGIRLTGLG